MMITTLLILHALLATFLLGACTHQAAGLLARTTRGNRFTRAYTATQGQLFVNAVILSYLGSMLLGAYLYPTYRLDARIALEEYRAYSIVGLFELKEHAAAIGLGLLPLYWHVWLGKLQHLRRSVTLLITLITWFTLIAGHVVNNYRGL